MDGNKGEFLKREIFLARGKWRNLKLAENFRTLEIQGRCAAMNNVQARMTKE